VEQDISPRADALQHEGQSRRVLEIEIGAGDRLAVKRSLDLLSLNRREHAQMAFRRDLSRLSMLVPLSTIEFEAVPLASWLDPHRHP
jgi:hypothetical protein